MVTQFSCSSRIFASVFALFIVKGLALPEVSNTTVTPRTETATEQPLVQGSNHRPMTLTNSEVALAAPQPSTSLLLSSAFSRLFNNSGQNASIPANTRLLSLQVKQDGVYVDLSREFATGGGSASMINRVTQVVYTATSLNPNAQVYISIEGQKLDDENPLAGEGLLVSYPTSRQQIAQDFASK
jgi:spore germination protein GerM